MAHLGDDGAVLEFDHRVDDRLRMHHYFDVSRSGIEQPAGLDHLESLVHHRSGIDRNLVAHVPLRMLQGLMERSLSDILPAPGAERAAGCGQMDLADRVAPGAQKALEDRRMLGIDRQDRRFHGHGKVHDEAAAGNEGLFVRQRYRLAGGDRRDCRPEAAEPDQSRQHHVDAVRGHKVAYRVHAGEDLDSMRLQGVCDFGIF